MTDFAAAAIPLFRAFPRLTTKTIEWSAHLRDRHSRQRQLQFNRVALALQAVDLHSEQLLSMLNRLPAACHAEQRLIRFGSIRHLRSIQSVPSGIGLTPVRDALRRGNGLILGCTHIGSFYHALIQAGRLSPDMLRRHWQSESLARHGEAALRAERHRHTRCLCNYSLGSPDCKAASSWGRCCDHAGHVRRLHAIARCTAFQPACGQPCRHLPTRSRHGCADRAGLRRDECPRRSLCGDRLHTEPGNFSDGACRGLQSTD